MIGLGLAAFHRATRYQLPEIVGAGDGVAGGAFTTGAAVACHLRRIDALQADAGCAAAQRVTVYGNRVGAAKRGCIASLCPHHRGTAGPHVVHEAPERPQQRGRDGNLQERHALAAAVLSPFRSSAVSPIVRPHGRRVQRDDLEGVKVAFWGRGGALKLEPRQIMAIYQTKVLPLR